MSNRQFCYDQYYGLRIQLDEISNPEDTYYYDSWGDCFCYDYCPSSVERPIYTLHHVAHWIYAIIAPFIFMFGITGNILILLMFQTKELKNMPSKPLFEALAVYDICALVSGYMFAFFDFGYDVYLATNDISCQLKAFTTYGSLTASSWLVAALSTDRFICVQWPFKANQIRGKHRIIGIVIITALIAVLELFFFFADEYKYDADDESGYCSRLTDTSSPLYTFYHTVWPWIDSTASFMLPFIVIIICNIGMIYNMKKSETTDVSSTSTKSSGVQASKRLSRLFVIISAMFMVMVLPLNAWYIYYSTALYYGTDPDNSYTDLLSAILKNLFYSNNAINFLIYCLGGSKFRLAFKSIMSSLRCKRE